MEPSLDAIIKKLEITQIYWIDDEHSRAEDLQLEKLIEELAKRISNGNPDSIGSIIGFFPEAKKPSLVTLKKRWGQSIKDKEEFDAFEQTLKILLEINTSLGGIPGILLEALNQLNGSMSTNEREVFRKVLGTNTPNNFYPISFTQWDNQKSSIYAARNPKALALILLDQVNVMERTASDGKTVLADLANKEGFKVVLVSNLIQIDSEFREVAKVKKELELDGDFLPTLFAFSKERLGKVNNEAAEEIKLFEENFAKFLSRFRLSDLSKLLASTTQQALTQAIDEAFIKLQRMSFEEFIFALELTSESEGVSEIDTLLRMFAIEQRRSLFEIVKTNNKARDLLSEMRSIEIPIESKKYLVSDASITELRHSEIYEPRETINSLLQPIVPGDIFRFTKLSKDENGLQISESGEFILVGSECDVILRKSGNRNFLGDAILLPITQDEVAGKGVAKLPSPLEIGGNKKIVNLRKVSTVPIVILDLCSYDLKGKAIWGNSADQIHQHRLLKSQLEHYKQLSTGEFSSAEKISVLKSRVKHFISSRRNNNLTIFNIQRISRLTPEHAKMITYEFSACLGRPAALHDYTDL